MKQALAKPSIDSSKLYILKAHPLSLKSNTSLVIVSPVSGSNTNFNFPGPGITKSVALYWSPNACLPITIGLVQVGTYLGIFLIMIGCLKTVPPKIFLMVPLGDLHYFF